MLLKISSRQAFLLFALALGLPMSALTEPLSLEAFVWKKRLLIYANLDKEEALEISKTLMSNQTQLSERNLVVGELKKNTLSFKQEIFSKKDSTKLTALLKDRAEKPSIILIGKDGEAKFIGDYNTSLLEIFKLIDSMPMRQSEIRNRSPR